MFKNARLTRWLHQEKANAAIECSGDVERYRVNFSHAPVWPTYQVSPARGGEGACDKPESIREQLRPEKTW
jgi:hypothetical protein